MERKDLIYRGFAQKEAFLKGPPLGSCDALIKDEGEYNMRGAL